MIEIPKLTEKDKDILLEYFTPELLKFFIEDDYVETDGHRVFYNLKYFFEYAYDGLYFTRVWTARDLIDRLHDKLRNGFGHDYWYDEELSEKNRQETLIDETGLIIYSEDDIEYHKGVKPLCLYL